MSPLYREQDAEARRGKDLAQELAVPGLGCITTLCLLSPFLSGDPYYTLTVLSSVI